MRMIMKSYWKKKSKKDKKKKVSITKKKVFVENTTSYLYGCEVVKQKDLPKFVNSFVSKSGLNRVIKVPTRIRGLTSSGKVRHCHPNVELLVDNFGGKRMVGYEVSMNKIKHIEFYYLTFHSVWVTPENKLVDVTKKDIPSILHGDEIQYFIPVSTDDILLKDIRSNSVYDKNLYEIGLFPEPLVKTRKKPFLEDLLVIEKRMEDMNGKDWKIGGSFSEPSISTGKYLPPRKTI